MFEKAQAAEDAARAARDALAFHDYSLQAVRERLNNLERRNGTD